MVSMIVKALVSPKNLGIMNFSSFSMGSYRAHMDLAFHSQAFISLLPNTDSR